MKVYAIIDNVDYDILAICHSRADAEEWILDCGITEMLSYSVEMPEEFAEMREAFINGWVYRFNCNNFYAYMLLHFTEDIYIKECEVY